MRVPAGWNVGDCVDSFVYVCVCVCIYHLFPARVCPDCRVMRSHESVSRDDLCASDEQSPYISYQQESASPCSDTCSRVVEERRWVRWANTHRGAVSKMKTEEETQGESMNIWIYRWDSFFLCCSFFKSLFYRHTAGCVKQTHCVTLNCVSPAVCSATSHSWLKIVEQ